MPPVRICGTVLWSGAEYPILYYLTPSSKVGTANGPEVSHVPPRVKSPDGGSPVILVLSRDCSAGYAVTVVAPSDVRTYAISTTDTGQIRALTLLVHGSETIIVKAYRQGVLRGSLEVTS